MSDASTFLDARQESEIEELRDWLHDQIDGGEECRGRDARISSYIRELDNLLFRNAVARMKGPNP